jgi:hypothetical protein
VIQKLNAQGRLEKKEAKKGTALFDKVFSLFIHIISLPILSFFCSDPIEDFSDHGICLFKTSLV